MTDRDAPAPSPEALQRAADAIGTQGDPARIVRVVEEHLRTLADFTIVGVFVFDAARARLRRHALAGGRELPHREIDLADFEAYSARAVRERREIYVEVEEGARAATRIPGTETTRSLWFGPILHGKELLGVLSVQSPRMGAYGEREMAIFRTFAGYVARALKR